MHTSDNFNKVCMLKDITNHNYQNIEKLNDEREQIRYKVDSQYTQARKMLARTEEEGQNVSMRLYEDLEILKRENEEISQTMKYHLSELDKITRENTELFDQLENKMNQIRHLEAYLKRMDEDTQEKGEKLYSDLCQRRQNNVDLQSTVTEIVADIKQLQKLIVKKEEEINKLSIQ